MLHKKINTAILLYIHLSMLWVFRMWRNISVNLDLIEVTHSGKLLSVCFGSHGSKLFFSSRKNSVCSHA